MPTFIDKTLAAIGLARASAAEDLSATKLGFPGYKAYRDAVGEAYPSLIWGNPQYGPRNYRTLALNFAAAYRCAVAIANEACRYPLRVVHRDTGKPVKPGNQSVPARLALLLRDGFDPYRSNRQIINTMCFDMAACGDAFLRIHGSRVVPTRLELMTPDGASVIVDSEGRPSFTLSNDGGQTSHQFPANEVVHPVLNSLLTGDSNRFRGIGPLQAAVMSVGVGAAGNDYTLREFSGDSVQAKYAYLRPDKMSPEQVKQVYDAVESASRRQGLLVLPGMRGPGGAETKFIALANANIGQSKGLAELKNYSVEDVCRAFGVPPAIAGVKGSQWGSGLVELKKMFLVFGVRPYLDAIADAFTQSFLRNQGAVDAMTGRRSRVRLSDYEVRHDLPPILAADGDAESTAKIWSMAGDGSPAMSKNEWRRWMGLPPLPGKENDEVPSKPDPANQERQRKEAADNDPAQAGRPNGQPEEGDGPESGDDQEDD